MDFKKPLSFDEFGKTGKEAWKIQALKELKKENLESLQWTTSENISLAPYYDDTSSSNLQAFHHHINPPHGFAVDPRWWENRQIITYKNDKETNKLILDLLNISVDGIIIVTNEKEIAFDDLLKDVKLSYCSISFLTGHPEVGQQYLKYIIKAADYKKISGGLIWTDVNACLKFLEKFDQIKSLPENFKYVSFYNPQQVYSIQDQLFFITEILEKCNEDQLNIIGQKIELHIELAEDFFQSLALVKAGRILLYQILKAYDISVKPENIFIQAISPPYKNDKYGPHENMLKSTTTAMAAITGGCNALVVMPEDENNMFMRRIAVNVSHILKEESYLSKNIDPSAGSYFVDHLVEQTAKKVWNSYQEKINNSL